MTAASVVDTVIDNVDTAVYRFPTPEPEADGTLTWDATTAVAVTVSCDGLTGLGWTYSSPVAASVIETHFAALVCGRGAHDITATAAAMQNAARNYGASGLVGQAISAVDMALWDLKAKLLDVPLTTLLGACRSEVPIYGSGGFVSSSDGQLAEDVAAWRAAGCRAMKIKIGKDWGTAPQWDVDRVALFGELASDGTELMVDANGAYRTAEAVRIGDELERFAIRWFEEPVSSDDTEGLRVLRSALHCDVAAGEYIGTTYDAERLAPVIDCLQADVTRCGGYTGFLRVAAIASAHNLEISTHCAPALHAPVAAAVPNLRHVEWFSDHVRLEPLLVQGVPAVGDGAMVVPSNRPGHGMALADDAESFRLITQEGKPGDSA
jgi:L-alanine-DL-glutamate epimerase-like enolase superfamily enzyme